jgi:hypothetical protein
VCSWWFVGFGLIAGCDLVFPLEAPPVIAGCAGSEVLFCDGFEAATIIPEWTPMMSIPEARIERQSTIVTRQLGALRTYTPSSDTGAYVQVNADVLDTHSAGNLFVRGYFYFEIDVQERVDFIEFDTESGFVVIQNNTGNINVFEAISASEPWWAGG